MPDSGVPDGPDAGPPVVPEPTGVVTIAGGPTGALAAVFVDAGDRAWVAHPTGVSVHESGSWRDSSAGLTMAIASFHGTPAGELFGSGALAGWRWESGTWVKRMDLRTCAVPLRLTSRGDLLFGVCAYYSWYVAWPTRDPAALEIARFTAGTAGDPAAVGVGDVASVGGDFYVISGPDYVGRTILRLPAGADYKDAANWIAVTLPAAVGTRDLLDLWSPGPSRLVVVGSRGLALTLDGDAWAVEDAGVTDDLRAVWGTDADGVYVVGAAGRILFRHRDASWRTLSSGTTENLLAVHGRTGGRVVVVGAAGTVREVVR
jgi:hypothetical protein